MIIVHVSCPTGLMLREVQDGGPGGDASGKAGKLGCCRPPKVSSDKKTTTIFCYIEMDSSVQIGVGLSKGSLIIHFELCVPIVVHSL